MSWPLSLLEVEIWEHCSPSYWWTVQSWDDKHTCWILWSALACKGTYFTEMNHVSDLPSWLMTANSLRDLLRVKQRQAWDDSVVERLMDIDPDLTEVQAILSSIRSFSSVGFWICGMITWLIPLFQTWNQDPLPPKDNHFCHWPCLSATGLCCPTKCPSSTHNRSGSNGKIRLGF